MKYIITESQHENLKHLLSEAYVLNSKTFVNHPGPNLTLVLNASPKQLISRIEKVISNVLKNLEDEYLLNDNLLSFEEFQNKVIDGIIDLHEKKHKLTRSEYQDFEKIRTFFFTITLAHLEKIYYKKAGGLEHTTKK
jgi:hypothetical protein